MHRCKWQTYPLVGEMGTRRARAHHERLLSRWVRAFVYMRCLRGAECVSAPLRVLRIACIRLPMTSESDGRGHRSRLVCDLSGITYVDTASTTGSYPPTLERKDSSSSLTKLQTPAQPAVSPPSPIPESPICEAAALSPDPTPALLKGPSSMLSGEVISAEGTESARGPTPAPSVPEEVPAPPPAQPIPTLVVNDPTDHAPSVFTDEPENCQYQIPSQHLLLRQHPLLHQPQRPHPNHPLHQHVSPHHPPRQPNLPRSNLLRHPNSDTLTSTTPRLLHPLLAPQFHPRPLRIPQMSGQNMHAPVKPLRLLKVKVHPYRSASCPRNSLWGPPFAGPGRRRRMVYPSHRLRCRAGRRVLVRSSRASRNSPGVPITEQFQPYWVPSGRLCYVGFLHLMFAIGV